MDVDSAIRDRRSIRRFRPDPLPEATVRKILDTARWSPSWANCQDWSVYIVTGEPLERFKVVLRETAVSGPPSKPDLPMPGDAWPEHIAARMAAPRPSALTRLSRKVARTLRPSDDVGDALYDAPCLLVLAADEGLPSNYACFDAGLLTQSVCLAAEARGIGSCIVAAAVRYPELLRELLPQARRQRFVVGVLLGLVDEAADVNRSERHRVDVDELVTWVGRENLPQTQNDPAATTGSFHWEGEGV